jgi:HlyD family secretion protein
VQFSHLEAELASRQERLARLKPLVEQGAISQEYLFQAEQSLRETEKQINQSQVQAITHDSEQIFQANQAMRELEARITNNQGELAAATEEVKRLQAELVRQQAQGEKTQLEAQQKIKQLELELAQIESKIADTGNLLVSAEAKLNQRSLTAPVAGIVYALNLNNPGRVLQAGETVLEIAPHQAPLVLTAALPIHQAGFVELGMPAQIKLDAYPYQDYGMILGTITSISTDAKSDEQLGAVYEIEVELQRNYITEGQRQIPFKAGQSATVDIVICRRRIIDVWLEPIRKLQQDGIKM